MEEKINFSDNEWYLHQGEFVSANSAGELVRIDEQGNVRKENLIAEGKPAVTATDEVLVSFTENVLVIADKKVTLDYGLYTTPKAMDLDGKIFITITDLQANRVYVFNEGGELLPGFPVYGTSQALLAREGENIVATVQGDQNKVLIYSF